MQKNTVEPKDKAFKSIWVWAIFGLFGLVFVVNYFFFSVALSTTSGLVTEKYYKYGLQQNKFDHQYRKQKARGWNVELHLNEPLKINQPHVVELTVMDKYSQPISGAHAEITAYRPSDAKADVVLTMSEVKPGYYQAKMTLPIQGVWDINLLFAQGDNKHMLNQRIIVQGDGEAELSTLEKIVKFITP
ncbi:MAG: FixH family protein [Ghiorsea sp.]|nr:FixH family protein [Ghiorsea sp.]